MMVEVRLFATLRDGRQKVEMIEFPEGSTVGKAIKKIGISRKDLAIILVNGRDGNLDTPLSPGDILSLFPPVGGG